jgi:hypothetical protein
VRRGCSSPPCPIVYRGQQALLDLRLERSVFREVIEFLEPFQDGEVHLDGGLSQFRVTIGGVRCQPPPQVLSHQYFPQRMRCIGKYSIRVIGCDKKGESPQPLMLSPIPDDGIAAHSFLHLPGHLLGL